MEEVSDGSLSTTILLLSLTGRTWDGEDGGVSYELIRQLSSKDEEGGGGEDDGEDRGERFPVSLRLWWMRAQSLCANYSVMNPRGKT